jgi:hypothetical protein
LELVNRGSSLRFPYPIVINKLLREVIDYTLDAAARAFGAASFAWFELAFDLMPFALRACTFLISA